MKDLQITSTSHERYFSSNMSYFLFERYQEKKSTMCLTADLIFPQVNKASEVIVTRYFCVLTKQKLKSYLLYNPTYTKSFYDVILASLYKSCCFASLSLTYLMSEDAFRL